MTTVEENVRVDQEDTTKIPNAKPSRRFGETARQILTRVRALGHISTEAPETETHPPEELNHTSEGEKTRRDILRAAFGLGGLAVLGSGLRIPQTEYLGDSDQRIHFIFADHSTDFGKVYNEYLKYGGLDYSVWNKSTLKAVTASMEAANRSGAKAYYCMVDSINLASFIPGASLQSLNLTTVPHPLDLSEKQQQKCPKKFYVIDADIVNNDFGLSDLSGIPPELGPSMTALINNLADRYNEPSLDKMLLEGLEILPGALKEKLAEGTLTAGMLAVALARTPEKTRRRFLQLIGPAAAAAVTKGIFQAGLPSLVTGILPSLAAQKDSTVVGNMTNWTIGDRPKMLFANARTALLVEKADEMTHDPSQIISDTLFQQTEPSRSRSHQESAGNETAQKSLQNISDNPPRQVDIILGAFHQNHAPEILSDQNARFAYIETYLKDLFQFTDECIREKYKELAPHRDALLSAMASSINYAEINQINLPWGRKTLPPEDIQSFEEGFAIPVAIYISKPIARFANKTLSRFGVRASV